MKRILCVMLSVVMLVSMLCIPVAAANVTDSMEVVKAITNPTVSNSSQGFSSKTWTNGVFTGTQNATWSKLLVTHEPFDATDIRSTGYIGYKMKTSAKPTKIQLAIDSKEPIEGTTQFHYTKNLTSIDTTKWLSNWEADKWIDVIVPMSSFGNQGKCYSAHSGTEFTAAHEIPYDFSHTYEFEFETTIASADIGATIEIKDLCYYDAKTVLSETCAVDIIKERQKNTANTWWGVGEDGQYRDAVAETVDPITNDKYVTSSFNEYGYIDLKCNQWPAWANMSSYVKNHSIQLTVKVPEGKMPTGDIYVELADEKYKVTKRKISVKNQITEGDWVDVNVKLSTFGNVATDGSTMDYANIRKITIRSNDSTVPAEISVKGAGIYLLKECEPWWKPMVCGTFISGATLYKGDAWNYNQSTIASDSQDAENGWLRIVPTAGKQNIWFEIQTTGSVNLKSVLSGSFLRLKMKSKTVPSKIEVWGMYDSYNGGSTEGSTPVTINGWTAETDTEENWYTLDIPASTFMWQGNNVVNNNKTLKGVNIKVTYAAAQDNPNPIDFADISIYGPERKLEVTDFKIVKNAVAVVNYNAADTLVLTATASNTTLVPQKFTMIGALYDSENKLIKMESYERTVAGNSSSVDVTGEFSIPDDATNTSVRAFVWNEFQGMEPLYKSSDASQTAA